MMTIDDVYIVSGRCRSGSRWFWIAARFGTDADIHRCDDPVCVYGGPHEYGWEDTEELALKAMTEAAARLGGDTLPGYIRSGEASAALKRINAAKRAARPPSGAKDTSIVEYLYAAYQSSWCDDMADEPHREVTACQVTRKTAKRIYYMRRPGEPPVIGYISRQDLEADTRCPGASGAEPCEHGCRNPHGDGPGEIRTGRWHDKDHHLFTTCSPPGRRPRITCSAGSESTRSTLPASSSCATRWPARTRTGAALLRRSWPPGAGTSAR